MFYHRTLWYNIPHPHDMHLLSSHHVLLIFLLICTWVKWPNKLILKFNISMQALSRSTFNFLKIWGGIMFSKGIWWALRMLQGCAYAWTTYCYSKVDKREWRFYHGTLWCNIHHPLHVYNLLSFHLALSMSLDILHKNRKICQHLFQFI
jgi:hypothetical protein